MPRSAIPHPRVWLPFARGVLLLWVLVHLVAAMFSFLAGAASLRLSVASSVWSVVVTLAVAMVDMARRRERIFLENLGVSVLQLGGILTGTLVVAETGLRLFVALR
jgi:multidrug transporter EmrE-like cation transporter